MSDSIKVAIKVRPLVKREKDDGQSVKWMVNENSMAPVDPELKKRYERFTFDHIFDMGQKNENVFKVVVEPILDGVVNGFNGTIFAYGQTGSGKTFTMMGSHDEPGIIPLSVNYIFDAISKTHGREFLLRVSYIEIYNERINDLLDKTAERLKIKDDPKTGQAFVKCKEEYIDCPKSVLRIMQKGEMNRRTGETNMNERSSRSHTIFRFMIESREQNDVDGAVHVSQLNLVDLAGSERAGQTGATGERFNEGRHINLSLSALGLVIMNLSESQSNPQKFINFRDSKLTRILQSSLGGNALTAIICAVTPAVVEETQCTLAFASRAKRVKNKPQLNEVASDAALLKRYAAQMAKLKSELEKVNAADVVEMESQLKEKTRDIQILEERLQLLQKFLVCSNNSTEEIFNRKAHRRRTWGGCAVNQGKQPLLEKIIGLPTIKELDRVPDNVNTQNFKANAKRRQSIFESLDLSQADFQTEMTDFELDLIEIERARERTRFSDASNEGDDDHLYVTKRPNRSVQFKDEDTILGGRTTPELSTDSSLPSSPDTPKVELRSKIRILNKECADLRTEHRDLENFAKLERQTFVEDAVQKATVEHRKIIASLREALTASDQYCQDINSKYTKLQNETAASDRRFAELEQQLAESASSLNDLKRQKQELVDELSKFKDSKSQVETQQSTNNEKETSSIFANETYFEHMNVSDAPCDSMLIDITHNIENLTAYDSSIANVTFAKLDESKKLKELANVAYAEFIQHIDEKSSDQCAKIIQELINAKCSLEDENTKLETMLQSKVREADDVKNDIRELKSGIEKLQETIHLLTTENTDLTCKLAAEKSTVAILNSSINEITEEKTLLENSLKQLDEKLKSMPQNATPPSDNEKEMQRLIKGYKETIESLKAENIELSESLMNQIGELEKLQANENLSGDHQCAYRELSENLSERIKVLEKENTELLNSIKKPHVASPAVDDLLRMSIMPDTSIQEQNNVLKPLTNGHTESTETEENETKLSKHGMTVDDFLQMSIVADVPVLKAEGFNEVDESSWKIKVEMLEKQVENLQLLNAKLSDLKVTSCTECAHLAELNENRKALKLESKALNKKLRELQDKFDREFADTEILRTKASEDMNLSICDLSINNSMMLDGSINVSIVEERVESLKQELQSLREKHDKLSNLYKEKCDEIEKLQDCTLRETSTPPSFSNSPRPKRNDAKLDRIQMDMDNLRVDYVQFKKTIAEISSALRKFDNDKAAMKTKIESLKTEKLALEKRNASVENVSVAPEIVEAFESEISRLNEVIERSNVAMQELEELRNSKSSFEAEVQSLKIIEAELEKETKSLKTENSILKAKVDETLLTCDEMKAKIIELIDDSTKHNDVHCTVEQLTEAVAKTEAQLEKVTGELECCKKSHEELEEALSISRKNEAELEKETKALTEENSILKATADETLLTCDQMKAKMIELIDDSTKHNDVRFTVEELNAVAKTEAQLEKVTGELECCKKSHEELEEALTISRKNEAELEKETKALKEENSILKATADETLLTCDQMKAKMIELIDDSTKHNDVRFTVEELNAVAKTEAQLEKVTGELECCKKAHEELEEALTISRKNEAELEKETKALKEENSILKATADETLLTCDQMKAKLIELIDDNTKHNDVHCTVEQLNEVVAKTEAQLEKVTGELECCKKSHAELEEALKISRKNENELKKVVSSLEEEMVALKNKWSCDEEILHKTQENNSTLIAEVKSMESKLKDLTHELNDTVKENVMLKEKFNELDAFNTVNEHTTNVAALNEKLIEIEQSKQDLTNENLALTNEITTLKDALRTLEETLSGVRATVQELVESNSSLSRELEKSKAKNAKHTETNVSSEPSNQTIKECENFVEHLRTEAQDITNNLHAEAKQTANLNNELTKLTTMKEELHSALSALDSEIKDLKAERSILEESVNSLRQTFEKLQQENASLITELEVLKCEKEKTKPESIESSNKTDLQEYENKIEALNARVKEITAELNQCAIENKELSAKVLELQSNNRNKSSEVKEISFMQVDEDIENEKETSDVKLQELESARQCITRELKSMLPQSDDQEFNEKSVTELFNLFVHTILTKEKEIIKTMSSRFEREKRHLEENKRQSVDAEKRVGVWAKELEAENERLQQQLIEQEAKNTELGNEIAKLQNLLKESHHENQMLNEKMAVLEVDFNTLQADLEINPHKQNSPFNTTQERERLFQEAVDSQEMELRSKLRLVEKQCKEKVEELTIIIDSYKAKTTDLATSLEGLAVNENHLKSIVAMKSNELVKCNNTIERIKGELEHLTELYNQSSRENTEKTRQIDDITLVLKNKCDMLSEYKTKLETITPEYEHLKDQAAERQLRLEEYKCEIECIKTESEKERSSLKDKLDSEVIKSASYHKQLTDLMNRNTVLQSELDALKIKCEELECSNAKLTKSMRNSTSKIRAEQEMEDLRDENRTLQRNLHGASNRITELQEIKTQLMKELAEIKTTYEVICHENMKTKNILATYKTSASEVIELREKYELILQEKTRVALELEDKKAMLLLLETKHESSVKENEELKKTNKDLDDEMEDMLSHIKDLEKENGELDNKLYAMTQAVESGNLGENSQEIERVKSQLRSYETDVKTLKSIEANLRCELKAALATSEMLARENSELRGRSTYSDRGDSKSCDSSRSGSPGLETASVVSRRRRSRTELFNQKRPLEAFEIADAPCGENCRCKALDQKVRQLEREIVTKNGQMASMDIKIQSENFPHMRRCKELEELLASVQRKNKTLALEIKTLKEISTSDCERCAKATNNKCDKSTQYVAREPIRLSGMSSGIVEDQIKMSKLERINKQLKELCHDRRRQIVVLEERIKEIEKTHTELTTHLQESGETPIPKIFKEQISTGGNKLDPSINSRQALKENVPANRVKHRPTVNMRNNWLFN